MDYIAAAEKTLSSRLILQVQDLCFAFKTLKVLPDVPVLQQSPGICAGKNQRDSTGVNKPSGNHFCGCSLPFPLLFQGDFLLSVLLRKMGIRVGWLYT